MNAEAGVCRAVFDALLTAPSSSSLSTPDEDEASKGSAGDGQGGQQKKGEEAQTAADSESIGTKKDVGDDATERFVSPSPPPLLFLAICRCIQ